MTSSRLFFRSVTCTRWAMHPGQVRAALEERARGAAAEVAGGGQVGGAWGAAQHLPLPHGTAELMAELQALVAGCNSTRALQVALCSPSRRRWSGTGCARRSFSSVFAGTGRQSSYDRMPSGFTRGVIFT